MRNTIKSLSLGLGLLLATSSAHAQWGGYHELGTTYSRTTPKGGTEQKVDLGGYSFLAISNKVSDKWSLSADFYTTFTYISAGEGDFDQSHGFLRVNAVEKGLNVLSGWESEARYRWVLPMAETTQGGFGTLQYRLGFTKKMEKFSFYWKPSVTIGLVDSGYQKLTTPGGTQKGNTLFSWGLELNPSYEIAKGWTVGGYTALSQKYTGGAPGKDGALGDVSLYLEPDITLPIVAWLDTSLSVNTSTTLNGDFDIDFGALTYTFKIGKAF